MTPGKPRWGSSTTRECPLAHNRPQASGGLVPAGPRLTASQMPTHPRHHGTRSRGAVTGQERHDATAAPAQSLAPPTQGRWRPHQFRTVPGCQSWLRSGKPSGGQTNVRRHSADTHGVSAARGIGRTSPSPLPEAVVCGKTINSSRTPSRRSRPISPDRAPCVLP